jgi:hypothetical protein
MKLYATLPIWVIWGLWGVVEVVEVYFDLVPARPEFRIFALAHFKDPLRDRFRAKVEGFGHFIFHFGGDGVWLWSRVLPIFVKGEG